MANFSKKFLLLPITFLIIIFLYQFRYHNSTYNRFRFYNNNNLITTRPNLTWSDVIVNKLEGVYGKIRPLKAAPTTAVPRQRFVTMCASTFNSRRTGNQLFNLAAMLFVAKLTGREPVIERNVPYGWLEKVIHHRIRIVNKIKPNYCPCLIVQEAKNYDPVFANLSQSFYSKFTTLELGGYTQTWRYVKPVDAELRRHLNFINDAQQLSSSFLRNHEENLRKTYNISSPAPFKVKYIGVHIRRGDMASFGFIFPTATKMYVKNAVRYYLNLRKLDSAIISGSDANLAQSKAKLKLKPAYSSANLTYHLVFVVCSDGIDWAMSTFADMALDAEIGVSVLFSRGRATEFDLSLLASCNDSIITSGTFSWWSGYLAGGRVVYYKNYPGNMYGPTFILDHYYPPNWIALL